MSLPAIEFWFSHSVRRNRKSFIIANLILFIIMACVIGTLIIFDVRLRAGFIIFFLYYIPFLIVQYFLAAQRLRDFGVTGWLALLWIPIAMLPSPYHTVASLVFLLILCSVPGTEGDNRYGSDPLQSRQRFIALLEDE